MTRTKNLYNYLHKKACDNDENVNRNKSEDEIHNGRCGGNDPGVMRANLNVDSVDSHIDEPEPELQQEQEVDQVVDQHKCKKVYAKRLPEGMMRDLISEYYHSTESLHRFMKNKDLSKNYQSFKSHWEKSGMAAMKEDSVTLMEALKTYDRWIQEGKTAIQKKNKINASKQKILPEEVESFMSFIIQEMALFGKGLGQRQVKNVIEGCLREYKVSKNNSAYCAKTFERFLSRYNFVCKNMKNIDPACASQVTPENRTMMFANLDSLVGMVHEMDPQNCPWTRWDEVPARFKYNMDEMSTDPTQHRNKIVLPKWIHERLFQSTPQGDDVNKLVLFFLFTYNQKLILSHCQLSF